MAIANMMNQTMTRNALILSVSVTLLGGCGHKKTTDESSSLMEGNTNETTSNTAEEQDNTLISGLWDISLEFQDDTVDERSIDIPEYGEYLTFYDYEGDQFGTGQNCHTRVIFTLIHVRDTGYLVNGDDPVAFKRSSKSILTQVNIDTTDEDGDGDTTDAFVQNWPLISGLSSTDYNICETTPQ